MTEITLRILGELITDQGQVLTYELGVAQLDFTLSSLEVMKQVPDVLRDLADQFDQGFETGEPGD